MRLEHHLVGGYVRYISPYIIIVQNVKRNAHSQKHKQIVSENGEGKLD